jgi:two-component system, cell cycle sensor histidine kinase and response regulator CckA
VRRGSSIGERFVESSSSSFLNVRLQLARLEVSDEERLDRILERAAQISSEQLQIERVGIWLFDPFRTQLTLKRLWRATERVCETPDTTLAVAEIPRYVEALLGRRVVAIEDVYSHEATAELDSYLRGHGIASMLDAPIFRQGQVIGVVCHEHVGPPRVFTTREVDFAASVADMIALYLEEAEVAAARQMILSQEKELLLSERLASVGVVAGHVAHDLNNAVAPILMCAQQLRTMVGADPGIRERLDIILQAAEHGAALARRLMLSSTNGTPVRDPIQIDAVLSEARPLLRAVAGEGVELTFTFDAGGAWVEVDPIELLRALINLVSNARDARTAATLHVRLVTCLTDDGRVQITVADDGSGMSGEVQRKLFEPFFTTKPGRGSGLGLAGVKGMLDALRGTIEIDSSPDGGTTVSLFFRRAADADGSRGA